MIWIKTILTNSILVICSCIIGLFLIEGFLVFENRFKSPEHISIDIHGHNYQFVKSKSNLSPLKLKKDEKEFVIVGDSFVEGVVCAKDDKNFPSQLSQKIKGKFNVVNLGVGGSNNADYVDFLDHFNVSNGDLAIIALYDNDIHISQRNCQQINRQSKKYGIYVPKFCTKETYVDKSNISFLQKVNNATQGFRIVQLLKAAIVQVPSLRKYFYRDQYRATWNDFESEENKWMRSSLRVIKELIINRGATPIFTYYPNVNKISDDDERHVIWKRFIEFIKKNDGIEMLDPYPFFIKKAPEESMLWSLTDHHPNCAAHGLMSEFVFNNLTLGN